VLHNCFISFVAQEIRKKLDEIAAACDRASSDFAQKICSMGSARIDLLGTEGREGEPKMRRDPDFSFTHRDAQWAGVILELSYPLKRNALPHLADDYLLESNGNIRMLVSLDLDTETKRGTISTWQPNFKRNEKGVIVELEAALVRDAEVFRDKYGNPNPDPESGLHLDLEDFGPPDLTIDLMDEVPISIDSATLCLLLAKAEARQLNVDQGRGGIPYKPKGLRIRKRRREEMESDNEVRGQEVIESRDIAGEITTADDTASGIISGPEILAEAENSLSRDDDIDDMNIVSKDTFIEQDQLVSATGLSPTAPSPPRKDS
jgi:hypothetical protein